MNEMVLIEFVKGVIDFISQIIVWVEIQGQSYKKSQKAKQI